MSSPSESQMYHLSSSPSPLAGSEPEQRSLTPSPTMDPRTSPVKSSQKRPYAEVIEERFPPFDAQSVVAEPYNNELKRDAEFQAKLNEQLLELIISMHAWASSRPKHETQTAGARLSEGVDAIQEVEMAQGRSPVPDSSMRWLSLHPRIFFDGQRTRAKLSDYISCVRTALANLTGMPF